MSDSQFGRAAGLPVVRRRDPAELPPLPRAKRAKAGHAARGFCVYLDFQNSAANNLGVPLPQGIVRVYKADPSGAQQFIGEDRIDHTPRGERVRIKMGEAFDVVGDRRQMDYDIISGCVSESAWEITVRNHKDQSVEVEVVISSSHRAEKLDAHTFRYIVTVGARDEAKIEYRVRVRWC